MAVHDKYAHLPLLPVDIRQRLARLPEALARHPVQLAYLFGSALQNPETANDIDLAVLPGEGYSLTVLYPDLSFLLSTDRLDIVELPSAPCWLQETILRTGTRIFAREPCAAARYEGGGVREVRLCPRVHGGDRPEPALDSGAWVSSGDMVPSAGGSASPHAPFRRGP